MGLRCRNRGWVYVGLRRRKIGKGGQILVQLVGVVLGRRGDGDLRGHGQQGTGHGRANDAEAAVVEGLNGLLTEAEVGRGIPSRQSSVQSRPNLGRGQAVGAEEDEIAIEGEGESDVNFVLG
jgi:hypothetical protein